MLRVRLAAVVADFPAEAKNLALIESPAALDKLAWGELTTRSDSLALPALAYALSQPNNTAVGHMLSHVTPHQQARYWYIIAFAIYVECRLRKINSNEWLLGLEACNIALRLLPGMVEAKRTRSLIYAALGQLTAALADRQWVV